MTPIIISDRWLKQVCESQKVNYERVSRIIIDAKAGEPVVMFITQYGDEGMVELTPPEVIAPEVTVL